MRLGFKSPILIIFIIVVGFFSIQIYNHNLKAKIEPLVSILPQTILPGDPVFITMNASSSPVEILWDKKKIPIFTYDGRSRGLFAVDFNEKVLKHEIRVKLNNGQIITTPITITPRQKIQKTLGIPEKLGGNTKEAGIALVNNLAKENIEINNIKTTVTPLWTKSFQAPLSSLTITDPYGYDRDTVGQTIIHKGTDFRASEGTEVRAMNKGVIRLAKTFTVYGNTIIIDHGLGLSTLYMHLSKINVKKGESVEAGQIIGLSGKTGYAEAAHLHISVKIAGISIDPVTFLGFFAQNSTYPQ